MSKLFVYLRQQLYFLYCFVFRNKMILDVKSMVTQKHRVSLHYWDSCIVNGDQFPNNLGDDLSKIVVGFMLNKKGISLDSVIGRRYVHLYAVGSIINMGYQNATVWGSGFLEELSTHDKIWQHYPLRKLDIRCVRGPKSRDNLIKLGYKCPETYGDPVILMPLFFSPSKSLKHDYIIIPHFRKEEEYRKKYDNDSIVSMVTGDYKSVIEFICSSKKVISSSLHGLILAESYNIPAVWLRDRGGVKDFKYYDYYCSTNRNNVFYASSIEEAIKMEPMPLPSNLDSLRNGLIQSFPYDLWA